MKGLCEDCSQTEEDQSWTHFGGTSTEWVQKIIFEELYRVGALFQENTKRARAYFFLTRGRPHENACCCLLPSFGWITSVFFANNDPLWQGSLNWLPYPFLSGPAGPDAGSAFCASEGLHAPEISIH